MIVGHWKTIFRIHLLKGENSNVLTLNLTLTGVCIRMKNLQRTDIKNVLFIEVNRHLVFSSQTFEMSNICIFIDLGFFKEREGVCRE